jgi:hypothetical protein
MMFGYLTLATALILSLSAAVYSILGLTAIFAAAFWPIVIMGGSLEIGKIITTLWLHKYWTKAEIQYKVYLCSAVAILMLLTSMGVFGFLSKAHLDQAVPSGDVAAKVQIFDDKIRTQQDNIKAARAALTQMDAAVDQTMSRSTTEQGADKAANLRRSQARERTALQNDISKAQKEITTLQEQRAPIASEMRKVEAEVGPIKYIAALIYGDNPEANVLEKAVRWVIILIVCVFDPLALTLLLAATKAFEWERGINIFEPNQRNEEKEEADKILKQGVANSNPDNNMPLADDLPVFEREEIPLEEEPVEKKFLWSGFGFPMSSIFNKPKEDPQEEVVTVEKDIEPYGDATQQLIMHTWKKSNPTETFKKYIDLFNAGKITELPWNHDDHTGSLNLSARDLITLRSRLTADNVIPPMPVGEVRGFGTSFPKTANKGDMFLRVDNLPSQLYKFNGTQWILTNKDLSDGYVYDDAYIDHLIEKISTGEYDPDLLSDVEKERIANRLRNNSSLG